MSVLQIKILLSLALLLLAAPVWAGELSNTSGSLRVQMGAKPQSGVDTSRCFLKGAPVPCVGHAYDQRVGSVAMESPIDGKMWVSQVPSADLIRCDEAMQVCEIRDPSKFPCYKRMQEVIREMKTAMHPNPNSRSLSRGFVMTEEAWEREIEPIYQECVK